MPTTPITIFTVAEGTDAINARIEDALDYISDELGHDFIHRAIRSSRRAHIQGHTVTKRSNDDAFLTICVDQPPWDRVEDAKNPGNAAADAATDGHMILVAPRDVPDNADALRAILSRGVTVHVVDAGIRIREAKTGGLSPAAERAIEAISNTNDADPDPDDGLTGHRHQGGRPPLGTKVQNGMLRADTEYAKVRQTLFRVENGEMSRTTAANRLYCVPKTIDNALERRELYRLDSIEP